MNFEERAFSFTELKWDTVFFGIPCAKAVLRGPVSKRDWDGLKELFNGFRFIVIQNNDSEPVNSKLVGTETAAFLADVNVQFVKKIESAENSGQADGISIFQSMPRDDRILELADFRFSRFIEDPELALRGGDGVYREWIKNSFGKPEKFFAVAESGGEICGYLLHSYEKDFCTIELIAVSDKIKKKGVGTGMFESVERAAGERGCSEIRVGTQLRNLPAINFYHKLGCRQAGCHQVYHLWR